ncbi:MAG: FprA family A-type flavoprotein, partial [Peptococcaceae bacterium]|nr:FprA family A-type flavoprotein [Peptococcaceae bacterium]
MNGTKNITKDIYYVGVNDHNVDLFEGQYVVPNGMAYNSYVIVDEKVAVFDTVSAGFEDEWLGNIKAVLDDKTPDYLIIQHMEPDHSANILNFANAYPEAKIVASAKAFVMMKNFFGTDFADRQVVVGEGDTLSLGAHNLTFVTAPMVHWPEVIVTYDSTDKVLFSADGFGKFGALDADEDWACEARRYYIGIVGKYGTPVQTLLKKASGLDIQIICPLHGPVLTENLGYYINLYNIWSSYAVETEGVVIAYTSVYGNTRKAVEKLAEKLSAAGCKVAVNDLARCDMAEAVEDAF